MLPSAPRGLARFAPKDVAARTDHPHEPGPAFERRIDGSFPLALD